MLAGLAVTLFYLFQRFGIMFIKSTDFLGDINPNWFFAIAPKAFGAVGAVVNFTVAMVVCKMTPEPPEKNQHLVGCIRSPA